MADKKRDGPGGPLRGARSVAEMTAPASAPSSRPEQHEGVPRNLGPGRLRQVAGAALERGAPSVQSGWRRDAWTGSVDQTRDWTAISVGYARS